MNFKGSVDILFFNWEWTTAKQDKSTRSCWSFSK